MRQQEAIQKLTAHDRHGRYVFNMYDLKKMFPDDSAKTLHQSIARLLKGQWLERTCRGIYINPHAHSKDAYTVEHIAKAIGFGEYNYVSLESMLSEYGLISQIPIDRLTVMTTGRSQTVYTPYGTIEFTHTKRPVVDIIQNIQTMPGRPLRIAKANTAVRDLKRVGRNTHLLEESDDEN